MSEGRADRHLQAGDRLRRFASRVSSLRSGGEDIIVRNTDQQRSCHVELEVIPSGGGRPFHKQYELMPGVTETEAAIFRMGTCEIRATLDNCYRESMRFQTNPSIDRTAVIEVGNGELRLTVEHDSDAEPERSG